MYAATVKGCRRQNVRKSAYPYLGTQGRTNLGSHNVFFLKEHNGHEEQNEVALCAAFAVKKMAHDKRDTQSLSKSHQLPVARNYEKAVSFKTKGVRALS